MKRGPYTSESQLKASGGVRAGGEQVPEDLEVRAVNERVREDLGLPGIKRARDPKGW